MNREIRLRAWDKRDKEMDSSFSLEDLILQSFPSEWFNESGEEFRTDDIVWMQSTGLKDIYGDDIVKISGEGYYSNDAFTVDEPEWEFIGKVEFSSFMWFVVQKDSTWFPFSDLLEHDNIDIEIIGNIYENENLLK